MEIKKPISAGELASVLAIWTVALIGCKNVAASALESYFPQYFIELIKPGAPMFGISKHVEFCVIFTLGASFVLFYCHDSAVKHINNAEEFLTTKLNNKHVKEILTILVLEFAMIFNVFTGKDISIIFIICLLLYVYPSNKFSYLAKLAIVPTLLLIMFAFSLPQGKNKHSGPYMVSTTCEGLEEIKVISALRIGNFVELTTETDPVLLNINAIIRIREIKESSEDAAKAPPAEQ